MPLTLRAADLDAVAQAIRDGARGPDRTRIVALDGRSGSGKSTLASALGPRLGASVIDGDDFFAGGVVVRADDARARVRDCIDWRRQRSVLDALRAGRVAQYRAFDWDAFDGRSEGAPTLVRPTPIVLLEGVYAARPELADLLAMRVLVTAADDVRRARLLEREGEIDAWASQWHDAEDWYFAHDAPRAVFDLEVTSAAVCS